MKANKLFVTIGLTLAMALGIGTSLTMSHDIKPATAAETSIYLKPGVWDKDGAWFAAYVWGSGGNTWKKLTDNGDDYYVAQIDTAAYPNVIFTRMDPSKTALGWDSKWNQTSDLTFPADKDCYKVTGWNAGDGEWINHPVTPVDPVFSLIGNFGGHNWDVDVDMAYSAGVATYSNLDLSAGDELKIRKDHDWTKAYGYSNLVSASEAYFNAPESGDNLIAKEDGKYSFSLDVADEEIIVTFTPAPVHYYVSVNGAADVELVADGTFTYKDGNDEDQTGYNYSATISASAGNALIFKRNSETIHPGASDPEGTNNLYYVPAAELAPSQVKVVQTVSNKKLTLKKYADGGFDTVYAGYVSDYQTYYFTNNKWSDVTPTVYMFNADNVAKSAWPGDAMSFADYDGYGQKRYSFVVDANKYVNLVISGSLNSSPVQTEDFSLADFDTHNGCYCLDPVSVNYPVAFYDYAAITQLLAIKTGETTVYKTLSLNVGTEYQTEILSVSAGQQVYVVNDDGNEKVKDESYSLKAIGNNNVTEDGFVLVDADDIRIYVDKNAKTIFVDGMPFGGYHIILNEHEFIEMTHGEDFDGYHQYYSASLPFTSGDLFRFVDTSKASELAVLFSITTISEYGAGSKFEVHNESGVDFLKALEDVTVQVYLKLKQGADEVYFGAEEEYVAEAKAFAKSFNEAIESACEIENINFRENQVRSNWAALATEYAALSDEAKTFWVTDKSVTVINEFIAKYDSVYQIRGVMWHLSNFLGREYQSQMINPVSVNNSMMIISVVSALVLITSVGVCFYFLRKRRLSK